MAKYKQDPITDGDISTYVAGQSDFAFECDVVRLLSDLGIPTEHGGTYDDPVTNKPRQFDVRSVIYKLEGEFGRQMYLAIESKNLQRNNPLVIHELRRKSPEWFHQIIGAWRRDPQPHAIPGQHVFSETITPSPQYPEGGHCGKATDQIHCLENGSLESDDRDVYEKWAQAISSAHDLLARAASSPTRFQIARCFSVVLPIVVVPDATLWVIKYSPTGQRSPPELADRSSFFVNKQVVYDRGPWRVGYRISHIEFMTIGGLRRFLGPLNSTVARGLDEWFPSDAIAKMRHQHDHTGQPA